MDENAYDEEFWADYQAQHDTFQDACLFNIVTIFGITIFNKFAYHISPLSSELYVKKITSSAYLCCC